MSMGVALHYSQPVTAIMGLREPTIRDRQREHFDRLEREHIERVRRAERLSRMWSAVGIATFFLAVALSIGGVWWVLR